MKLEISYKEYENMYKKASRNSATVHNCVKAFVIGGAICAVGQGLVEGCSMLGLSDKTASTAATLTLILLSVTLTAFSLYDKIAKHGGAGTLVPVTGFANAVAAPAIEFKTEGLITGTAVKLFTIAGPVILFGILSGVVYGAVYYVYTLF